jgi:hypothetical protein
VSDIAWQSNLQKGADDFPSAGLRKIKKMRSQVAQYDAGRFSGQFILTGRLVKIRNSDFQIDLFFTPQPVTSNPQRAPESGSIAF